MIQCVCLNPAHQKTLTIKNFLPGTVNRVTGKVVESVGGKGINVARVLKTLGQPVIITGFIGGETGKVIEENLVQEGLKYDFVYTTHNTRTCTTILDPLKQTQTELVEAGNRVLTAEIKEMYRLYERNLQKCTGVVIAGTASPGVSDDIYYQLAQRATVKGIPVFVDTQKNFLKQSLQANLFLVKITREELATAFCQPINSPQQLEMLIRQVQETGVEWLVLTHGKENIIVAYRDQRWEISPPSVKVINAIGSGDTMLAGIATAIHQGKEILSAICFGVACGTANVLTLTPGVIRLEEVEHLVPQVRVLSSD